MDNKQGTSEYRALLNAGEENELELFGYRTERWRSALCILGYFFSLGLLLLLFYWKPEWDIWCHCAPCRVEEANVVLLRTTDDFKKCFKKMVCWIQPFSSFGDEQPCMIFDEKSVINKALIMQKRKTSRDLFSCNLIKKSNEMLYETHVSFGEETSKIISLIPNHNTQVRYITAQKIRYVWNALERKFQKIGVLEEEYSCSDIHSKFGSGFSKKEQEIRGYVCGSNSIDVKVIPIWKLLFKEVLNPFFIYQLSALCFWIGLDYLEYSIAILFISIISVAVTTYNLRKESVKLHNLVESHNSVKVTILRKNQVTEVVESRCLVPGDVIVVPENKFYMPCDAILITGGCIVNEGMLTGESVPVTKMPLPNVNNSVPWKTHCGDDYKKHVLFCGTEVIQTKSSNKGLVKAVVLHTGFNTTKGDLIRSILYPKPVNLKMYKDVIKFFMGLSALAVVGALYTALVLTKQDTPVGDTVLWCMLVITSSIPPILPASLTVGIMYSQKRLQRTGIYCLSAQRINMCGRLNIICFDKTGTLTEDGMKLWGMIPSDGKCFQKVHCFTPEKKLQWGHIMGAMVSCHSLILLDGKIHGDPLDMEMFKETGWELQEVKTPLGEEATSDIIVKPGENMEKVQVEGVTVLHQFPFSSSLQRMSVIAQVIGKDELLVYMKGAPEMVIQFSLPETVPLNFQEELELYALQGYRVIALAYKILTIKNHLNAKSLEREEVESGLTFLGLLIMENKLKPETKPVLQELQAANIRTVMITGDNLQTACTVGKVSGMVPDSEKLILIKARPPEGNSPASITWQAVEEKSINGTVKKDLETDIYEESCGYSKTNNFHFAINGKSYEVIEKYFYNMLPKILLNGTIFARMGPRQKTNLVEEIKKLDYFVGMCGDGANDCGALKTAHAGISLSETEASVASPFTSKTPNIECVTKLIKEGRNSLVTGFCMLKFVILNTMICLQTMLILFWKQLYIGDRLYLTQDLAISLVATLTMSLTGPAPRLAPYRPSAQLTSPPLLLSMTLQFIIGLITQTIAFTTTQQQLWYNESDILSACLPLNHSTTNDTVKEEISPNKHIMVTTLWFISTMHLIIIEFVYSKGMPFRIPIYRNYLFFSLMLVQVAVFLFLYFADLENIYHTLELVCTPYYWRVNILIMVAVLFAVSFIIEEGFIENQKCWLLIKRIFNFQSKSQYKKLQRLLEQDIYWPPQNRTDYTNSVETEIKVETQIYHNQILPVTENADFNGMSGIDFV